MSIRFGACIGTDTDKLAALAAAGYDYAEASIQAIAAMTDSEYESFAACAKSCPITVEACNSFFPGEKAHVTISGNQQVTKLFVNGKLVETLDKQTLYHNEGGKDKMYYVRTLVFPLEKTDNFKSKVTNFKVETKFRQFVLVLNCAAFVWS